MKAFESALARLRKREMEEDFKCLNGIPKWILGLPIEEQFAKAYTHNIFFQFQREWVALIELRFGLLENIGQFRVYVVKDGHMEYRVDFDGTNNTVRCQFHLFVSDGIICRHSLLVFREEEVHTVPSCYVLDR